MATLLFIHGTGVRGESYFRTVDLIARKVEKFLTKYNFKSCQWGDPYGARLNEEGASIPGYEESVRADSALEDASIARWHLLSEDPLLELRILPHGAVVGIPPGTRIWKSFEELAEHPKILFLLNGWALDTAWARYMKSVLADETWKRKIEPITEMAAAISDRVARGVTAGFQIYIRQESLPGLAAPQRDRLKNVLIQAVGGPALGVGDWFLDRLTNAVRVRRVSVTDSTSPMVGDILRYQARGREIRNFIRETVERCEDSVVILA